ncbi:hypothetical protein MAPG_03663 [Magnaporthiopsis poae ATCC 64411]|uniref:BTB domain-containing protein n=1 Tax=Magnaporthiopsis poae (strain ATCC 64411 / 73-15) TaxID=644358 RepID=A0A0C4DUM3_MAGP6|nr:hypothetical protein MAPG_03663 [Magnaporthiopsis poae ATCC 64411]
MPKPHKLGWCSCGTRFFLGWSAHFTHHLSYFLASSFFPIQEAINADLIADQTTHVAMTATSTPQAKSLFRLVPEGFVSMKKESFDDSGDLQLIVGAEGSPEITTFTVCSRALSRGSPVFRRMLNGPWTEKQPLDGSAWTVKLPEDHPSSMRVLLGILHAHFRHVHPIWPILQLYQLCVCADKYDITQPLSPWAASWCMQTRMTPRATTEDNAQAAWIAWVLGDKELLEMATKELVWKSKPASLRSMTAPCLVHLDSTGILERVKGTQRVKAARFVETLQDIWRQYLPSQALGNICVESSYSASSEDKKCCGILILGSLTASLNSAGLLPSSKPPKYEDITLHDLGDSGRRIAQEIVTRPSRGSNTHKSCGPGLKILLAANTIQNPATILTDADCEHLSKRAKEIGVVHSLF